ncbi:MAG: phosphate ABC transporter permease subunit PstC [Armatimonadota bacterium]|nr:phosphate ABC transporter permease subunit PstC [Armatimonadota bacterium]
MIGSATRLEAPAMTSTAQARRRQRLACAAFRLCASLCGLLIIAVMTGILLELLLNSRQAISTFGWKFLVSAEWDPVAGKFGALSSIYGTVVSTLIALIIAVPTSLVIALFLVELCPKRLSGFFRTAIELLAAIPSIIYGMWGLFVFAPFMAEHVQPLLSEYLGFIPFFQGTPMGIGMLTAGVILALMILPFVSSVMRDVLEMVPAVLKESAYGLGATTWEATKDVSLRYGKAGMVGAIFLGLGRAIGETMAVTFVIGNDHSLSASLFASGNTIASTLANEFTEASDPLYLSALVELGLVLFLMASIFQIIAQLWLRAATSKMGAQ